jgi:predicted RNA binding protein YcfA (HicA-like mRNA interferase family)
MTKLPRDLTGDRVVRALERLGFYRDHQVGAHVTLRHQDDPTRKVVVPLHGSMRIGPKLLSRILREAGVSSERLIESL